MMTNFFELPFKLDFTIDLLLLGLTAIVMIAACIRLILSKILLESIVIMSVFSLFISLCYLFLDAPDVAMTEVALGASLSSCVLLNIIYIAGEDAKESSRLRKILAAILCLIFIAFLTFASLDLPKFGAPITPVNKHVSEYYLKNTHQDIGIPSVVAAILASYRGFDTLGETTVILIAGLGVLVIISRRKKADA